MRTAALSLFSCGLLVSTALHPDVDLPTRFTNRDSVVNTRHNLALTNTGGKWIMDHARNDYGEVCVYCHTPHGANHETTTSLWNRAIPDRLYETYERLDTPFQGEQVTQPGRNSTTCLSCHDGTMAVDSVINMPGSNYFKKSQMYSQNDHFLNSWPDQGPIPTTRHLRLADRGKSTSCLSCHDRESGPSGRDATDFSAFVIGTDLRDDHPVGVRYPTIRQGTEFHIPTQQGPGVTYFDRDGNQRADNYEVMLFNVGDGPKVECASCHDPHGVSSYYGPGALVPAFLRMSNDGSRLCLTCHMM